MIPELTPQEIRRFYGKLRLAGCGLTWTGPVNNHGYGRFEIYRAGRRVRVLAHRLAFKLATGADPDRAVVRHGCDTRRCCTPDCLLTGTQAQNVQDAIDRGRANTAGLSTYRAQRDERALDRVATGEKRCSRCRTTKPLTEFPRNRSTVDGRGYWCSACVSGMSERDRRRVSQSRREVAA